jgi:small subunit ribosomal protein S4
VNGRRVDWPSYLVKIGDDLEVSGRARRMPSVIAAVDAGPEIAMPGYLKRESDPYTDRVFGLPSRADIPFEVQEMAVIEFYAR